MKSKPNKHDQRSAIARAKLIDAAIEMIARRGLPGLAITNLGAEAGVSRGLANYHFADRGELIAAAFDGLLEDDPQPEGLGLSALFGWISDQGQRAERHDPGLLALLQLGVGPGVEVEAPALREDYWRRRSQLIERHLSAAQAAGQVRDDLKPSDLAGVLLGLLHGELLRIAATGGTPSATFTTLIERALAPERPATARRAPKIAPPPAAEPEPELKPEPRPVQGHLFAPPPSTPD